MAEEEVNIKAETNKLVKKGKAFFRGKEKLIVPLIFLLSIGYCAFLWYSQLYKSQWSEKQKQEYRDNKGKEIVFNEKQYGGVISVLAERQKEFEKKIENVSDVFQINK